MGMRRLGVMGGTFDPIHNGHLVAASEAAAALSLDEVIFVPTNDSYQKTDFAPAEHRYLMTVIATAGNPRFSVSRVEIDRQGPSFTADTLRELGETYPDAELFFITGADAVSNLSTWHQYPDILELANFVAVTRPGHDFKLPAEVADRVPILEIPAMAISSTDIRSRVRENRPIWYLVPDGIVQYIAKTNLYREVW